VFLKKKELKLAASTAAILKDGDAILFHTISLN